MSETEPLNFRKDHMLSRLERIQLNSSRAKGTGIRAIRVGVLPIFSSATLWSYGGEVLKLGENFTFIESIRGTIQFSSAQWMGEIGILW